MKAYVSLDNQSYGSKPTRIEIPKIKHRTVLKWREIEIGELADLVGNKGCTMVPAHLVDGIASRNFTGIQLFTLDFDDGCKFEDIKKRCKDLNIPISFAYHTFSSSLEEERFRVVFIYECLIEDRFVAEVILYMLMKIFPECDGSCKNLDRMFFGGKELIYFNDDAYIALVQLLSPFYYAIDNGGHLQRNLETFSRKKKVLLFNGFPAIGKITDLDSIFGEKIDSASIHIIGETKNSPFFIAERDGMHPSITCREKKRRLDFYNVHGVCRLLDQFMEGEKLSHEARFAILTNFLHIEGGGKYFIDVLEGLHDEAKCEKWKKDMRYMKGYHSMRCSSSFCPYYDSCVNAGTIVDTLALDRKVYKIKEEKYYSLEESWEHLMKNIQTAFTYPGTGIHLIKAQTALGKTTAYIQLIKENPGEKFLIALPTNILKKQVKKDLICAGISEEDVFMTESVQGNCFIPDEIQDEITNAHKQGFHNRTKKILSSFYKEKKDGPETALKNDVKKLLDGINAIKGERVVVTTHAFFLQMPEKFLSQYTIIIDEDILQLQIFNQIRSVSVECLEELIEKEIPGFSDIAGRVLGEGLNKYGKLNGYYRCPLMDHEIEKLKWFDGEDNVNDLIYARTFVKLKDRCTGNIEVKYFCPQKLPKLKYIVLSATLNEKIYQAYFKESGLDIYLYQEKKASYKGKLIQYTYHSLGRRDLSGKQQVFSFVKERLGNLKPEIITFKENQKLPELSDMNSKGLHFGNTTGINALSGRDLGIVGTPYKVEEAYKLVACYLGADVNQKQDETPKWRRVTYKNFSFLLTTYHDPLLREVQLYALESELEQCVGRARLLRKDCTVYVFSAFPCEQAKIIIEDYLPKKDVLGS